MTDQEVRISTLREARRILYGPRDAAGADTYVLCEINASSCFAIPDEAPAAIARRVKLRLLGDFESSSLAAAPERSKG